MACVRDKDVPYMTNCHRTIKFQKLLMLVAIVVAYGYSGTLGYEVANLIT